MTQRFQGWVPPAPVSELIRETEILEIDYHKKELTYLECKYQFTLGVLESRSYLNDNILGKFFDKDFA